jgi:hypothetical protein
LEASAVDRTTGAEYEKLRQFQKHLADYKIIAFHGLNSDRAMLSENSFSAKN